MSIHLDNWRRVLDRLQAEDLLGPPGSTEHRTWDEAEVGDYLALMLDTLDDIPDYLQTIEREVRIRGRRGIEPSSAARPASPVPAKGSSRATPDALSRAGFARVPNKVIDALAPVMSGMTWKALVYCYRLADRDGAFFIGYGRLSKAMGSKHRKTGQDVMARLMASGLIERTRKGAAGWACHYRMIEIAKVNVEKAKAVLALSREEADDL